MSVCGRLLPPSNTTAALGRLYDSQCFAFWLSCWGVALSFLFFLFNNSLRFSLVCFAWSELPVKEFVDQSKNFNSGMSLQWYFSLLHFGQWQKVTSATHPTKHQNMKFVYFHGELSCTCFISENLKCKLLRHFMVNIFIMKIMSQQDQF